MSLSSKFIRMQIAFFKPFADECSIQTSRSAQDALGSLMTKINGNDIISEQKSFENFEAEWLIPKVLRGDSVILYLHGGGYTAGDIKYARGFGSVLASKMAKRVFCAAYRLAPECKYPAALEDALEAYRYLLDSGYSPKNIYLCGESAGGGLCAALCLKINMEGIELPSGVVMISPWVDLTQSGASYTYNRDNDPSLSKERLDTYAKMYAPECESEPLCSPLFGDLSSFPPSLIFVGGDEVLKDDSVSFHSKLLQAGHISELVISEGMWHAYPLYGVTESKGDFIKMSAFFAGK